MISSRSARRPLSALLAGLIAGCIFGAIGAWSVPVGRAASLGTSADSRVASAAPAARASARVGVAASVPVTRVATVRRAVTAAPNDQAAAAAYARAFRSGPRTKKVVALTFDDGYSPTETLAVLRILKAEHVKATFFPYARAVVEAPSVWRQIAAAGYPIGNHTYRHVNLTHLSEAGVVAELTRARVAVEHVTGIREPPIVRPPYGAYTTATREAAVRAGYPTLVLWDVDTRDWSGIGVSTVIARAVIGRQGSIVLMHAGPANTPRALGAIIARYRARGYDFVTVPELLGLPWP